MKINQLGKVAEAKMKCNETPAGEACPVHGLKECSGYSMTESAEEVTCSQCGKGFSAKGLKAPYHTGFSHCKDHKGMKVVSEKFDALKHVKNPTPGEKKAAKDVKRGSYADRSAMLKSAEKDGRLKEAHILSMHVEDDHEVKMAQGDLYQMAKKTIALHKMLDNVDQLEGWVQGKITLAADYVATVYDYMDHQLAMAGNIDGIGEQMAEAIVPTGSTVSAKKLPPQTAQVAKKVAQGLNTSQHSVMTDPEGNVSIVAKKDVAKKNAQGNMEVTEEDNAPAEQYKSLNDVYPAGSTEIWYWKDDFGRDAMMGANWLAKHNRMPKPENISDNYVLIGKIAETNLDKIYMKMQGEMWSPRGQARSMIRSSGTGHTSMSMGDIVKIGGKFMMVDRFGWHDISQQPQEEGYQPLRKKPMDEGVMSEIDLELAEIVKTQDMDALYDLLTANTPTGKYVQNMADDIAIDNRFLDDDHEELLTAVMDRLEDDYGVDESTFADAGATLGGTLGGAGGFALSKKKSGYVAGAAVGSAIGATAGKWLDKKLGNQDKIDAKEEVEELDEADSYSIRNTESDTDKIYHISKYPITSNHSIYKKIKAKDPKAQIHKNGQPMKEEADEPEADGNENGIYQMRKVINLRGQYDVPFADGKKVRVPVNMAHAVLQKFASLRMPNDKLAFTRAVTKSFDSLKAAIGVREDVDARARKIFGEDWGSSDTSAAINMMKEYIRSTHGGRYNPETIEDAARDAGEFYYDQMGYETPEDAADSLVSHFVRRWMSGSLKAD